MNALRIRLLATVGVGLLVNFVIQPWRALSFFGATDFQTFDAAGRIVRTGGCLYCVGTQMSVTHAVAGGATGADGLFISPPLVAWLFAPLTGMEAHVALALFLGLSLLALAGAGWLVATRWLPELPVAQRVGIVVASLMSVPAAYGIAIGQIDPIIFAAVVAGITLSRRFPLVGGILIGSLALKPQLFVLVPVALLAAREWRVLAGCGISTAAVVASLFGSGVAHVLDWPRFVAAYGSYHGAGMSSLPPLVGNLTGSGAAAVLATVVLFGVGAVVVWRSPPPGRRGGGGRGAGVHPARDPAPLPLRPRVPAHPAGRDGAARLDTGDGLRAAPVGGGGHGLRGRVRGRGAAPARPARHPDRQAHARAPAPAGRAEGRLMARRVKVETILRTTRTAILFGGTVKGGKDDGLNLSWSMRLDQGGATLRDAVLESLVTSDCEVEVELP